MLSNQSHKSIKNYGVPVLCMTEILPRHLCMRRFMWEEQLALYFDAMLSYADHTILARIPWEFYAGEICMTGGAVHNNRNVVHNSDGHANPSCIEISWYLGKNCMIGITEHNIHRFVRRRVECTDVFILQLGFLWWVAYSCSLDTQQAIPNWPIWC